MTEQESVDFASKLGISVESAQGYATANMPVEGNCQPFGIVHGGANAALVEHLASIRACELAPGGTVPVGVSLEVEHIKAVRSGMLHARTSDVAVSKAGATVSVDITNDEGVRTARGALTLVFVPEERLATLGR